MGFLKNLLRKLPRWSKWILLAILIIILLLILRSCFGGQGILFNTTYHIARSASWYPIQLSGKEDNLQAFFDELITDIAQDQELKVDITTYTSGDLFAKLNDDEYDGILVTVSPDSFLLTRYAVSNSIFSAGPVLIVRSESTAKSIAELKGRPIGVIKDSPISFRVMNQHPDMLLISYDDVVSALNAVVSQSTAGLILEAQLAYTYTQALFPGQLKVATAPLFDLGIRLIARKEKRGEELIEHFNKGLEKLKANGGYTRLLKRWELVVPK